MRVIVAFAFAALQASGLGDPSTRPYHAIDEANFVRIATAVQLMTDNQRQEALEVLTTAVSAYEAAFASEPRRLYCSMSPQQEAAYRATAEKDSAKAAMIGPTYCKALFLKGDVLAQMGRGEEALATFDHAISLAPLDPHLLIERGNAFRAMKNWPAELATCERGEAMVSMAPAVAQSREHSLALRCQGFALLHEGRTDEGAARFRAALTVDPTDRASASELTFLAQHGQSR